MQLTVLLSLTSAVLRKMLPCPGHMAHLCAQEHLTSGKVGVVVMHQCISVERVCALLEAAKTCTGGGDCDVKTGGGLPMIVMPRGGGGPSKPPPLVPPLTPPLTPRSIGCVGLLPIAYTSHWALQQP